MIYSAEQLQKWLQHAVVRDGPPPASSGRLARAMLRVAAESATALAPWLELQQPLPIARKLSDVDVLSLAMFGAATDPSRACILEIPPDALTDPQTRDRFVAETRRQVSLGLVATFAQSYWMSSDARRHVSESSNAIGEAKEVANARAPLIATACARVVLRGATPAPVRVAPSAVHGRGVFVTRTVRPGELLTNYPIHRVELRRDGLLDAQHHLLSLPCNECTPVLPSECADYGLDLGDGVCISGDPAVHSPDACGHLVNSVTNDTLIGHNCAIVPLFGGMVVAMIATTTIDAGAEVFVFYGDDYWRDRAWGRGTE